MKKGIILTLLIFFGVSISVGVAHASFSGLFGIFGGRIVSDRALEIGELEDFGYICDVPGYSIEIMPIGSPVGTPTSYLIPYSTRSMTGTVPSSGKLIIGRYIGKTEVVCQHPESEDIQTVPLDTVDLYGTTK